MLCTNIQAASGDVLVIERLTGSVLLLWDDDHDGVSGPEERLVLGQAPVINHGLVYHKGFVYVSQPAFVYRFAWAGERVPFSAPMEVVVQNIPTGETLNDTRGTGHLTRAIAIDELDRLYVQVGSYSNIDSSDWRSRIHRFYLSNSNSTAMALALPFDFQQGELFVRGVRNALSMRFFYGAMWFVEMGSDNLKDYRADLANGTDINLTEDNPLEKLNRADLNTTGMSYGYPQCFTAGKVPGKELGWQFGITPDLDEFCNTPGNIVTPALGFAAHSSPIGLDFYTADAASGIYGFPSDYVGDAFVALHGSWNRQIPTGYRIVRVKFVDGWPRTYTAFLYWNASSNSSDTPHNNNRAWKRRFCDLKVGPDGALYITDDARNAIYVVRNQPAASDPAPVSPSPAPTPSPSHFATAIPVFIPSPSDVPSRLQSGSPTPSPTPSQSLLPSNTESPSPSIAASSTDLPSATIVSSGPVNFTLYIYESSAASLTNQDLQQIIADIANIPAEHVSVSELPPQSRRRRLFAADTDLVVTYSIQIMDSSERTAAEAVELVVAAAQNLDKRLTQVGVAALQEDGQQPILLAVPDQPPSTTPAPSSGSSVPVGAIVGIVIGGVAFLAIVAFITMYGIKMQRRRSLHTTAASVHLTLSDPPEAVV
eukprot:CAMPEP_0184671436 /NCGR_PEP_ID=MMETSP0308-20130426/85501_1 /TAXON_ID=38269 /ORGANISM="Gloeochaete witrockiana, Strain SAG 46.84" /LENGTH=651 /DNA_ID=CAMNT_0027118565 /DNA_START=2264 /DNA_END=4219 /DNA_ORIENTATION=-